MTTTGYLNDDHGYFEAARAETARVIAFYGESPRYTVVRVDGEIDEDADDWPPSASDWSRREEDTAMREWEDT